MSDFLGRLAQRTLGHVSVLEPLALRFARGTLSLGPLRESRRAPTEPPMRYRARGRAVFSLPRQDAEHRDAEPGSEWPTTTGLLAMSHRGRDSALARGEDPAATDAIPSDAARTARSSFPGDASEPHPDVLTETTTPAAEPRPEVPGNVSEASSSLQPMPREHTTAMALTTSHEPGTAMAESRPGASEPRPRTGATPMTAVTVPAARGQGESTYRQPSTIKSEKDESGDSAVSLMASHPARARGAGEPAGVQVQPHRFTMADATSRMLSLMDAPETGTPMVMAEALRPASPVLRAPAQQAAGADTPAVHFDASSNDDSTAQPATATDVKPPHAGHDPSRSRTAPPFLPNRPARTEPGVASSEIQHPDAGAPQAVLTASPKVLPGTGESSHQAPPVAPLLQRHADPSLIPASLRPVASISSPLVKSHAASPEFAAANLRVNPSADNPIHSHSSKPPIESPGPVARADRPDAAAPQPVETRTGSRALSHQPRVMVRPFRRVDKGTAPAPVFRLGENHVDDAGIRPTHAARNTLLQQTTHQPSVSTPQTPATLSRSPASSTVTTALHSRSPVPGTAAKSASPSHSPLPGTAAKSALPSRSPVPDTATPTATPVRPAISGIGPDTMRSPVDLPGTRSAVSRVSANLGTSRHARQSARDLATLELAGHETNEAARPPAGSTDTPPAIRTMTPQTPAAVRTLQRKASAAAATSNVRFTGSSAASAATRPVRSTPIVHRHEGVSLPHAGDVPMPVTATPTATTHGTVPRVEQSPGRANKAASGSNPEADTPLSFASGRQNPTTMQAPRRPPDDTRSHIESRPADKGPAAIFPPTKTETGRSQQPRVLLPRTMKLANHPASRGPTPESDTALEPVIRVRIGQITVHAASPSTPPPAPARPKPSMLSLSDYLRTREEARS